MPAIGLSGGNACISMLDLGRGLAKMTVHLNNAPIVEALIDIQCEWGAGLTHDAAIKALDGLVASVRGNFSKIEPRIQQQIEFRAPPAQPAVSNRHEGYLLRAEASAVVVQFKRNGFTYSKLAPYQTWESLRDDAKKYWDLYCSIVGSATVKRVATRYINKIQVPFPFTGDEDHLRGIRKPLTEPSDFSQIVSFGEQTVSVDAPSGATVGFIRATQPRVHGATHVDVILDIDVFREIADLNATDGSVWTVINRFQEVKNRLFFAAVGPSIVEKHR